MKLAALAFPVAVVAATGCTTTDPVDLTAGAWQRLDEQGRVIDQLKLDDAGQFESSCVYYWETGPSIGGDYSFVRGSYEVFDVGRMRLSGTTRDGMSFELVTTYHVTDEYFALAPYVRTDGIQYDAVYDRRTEGTWSVLDWNHRPHMWLPETSYLIEYVDPIWGDPDTLGGDVKAERDGSLLFDDGVRFVSLDDGVAIARDEPFHRCLDYNPMPLDAGMLYTRQQTVL
jgi:hypothetical protein